MSQLLFNIRKKITPEVLIRFFFEFAYNVNTAFQNVVFLETKTRRIALRDTGISRCSCEPSKHRTIFKNESNEFGSGQLIFCVKIPFNKRHLIFALYKMFVWLNMCLLIGTSFINLLLSHRTRNANKCSWQFNILHRYIGLGWLKKTKKQPRCALSSYFHSLMRF